MNKLVQFLRQDQQRRRRYFQTAKVEIASRNLTMLRGVSAIICVLLLFFCGITPLIIEGWRLKPAHLAVLPLGLVFFLVSSYLKTREKVPDNRLVTVICLLFELLVLVAVASVDIPSGQPVSPGTFTPFLLVALPSLFVIPFRYQFSMLVWFEFCYIHALYRTKTGITAQQDVLNSVVGLVVSFALAHIIFLLLIQEYNIRSKYRDMSQRDSLSGILNKQACISAMDAYLQSQPRANCAMLMLDIDDFKVVNDSVGHFTGDVLLRTIGNTLTEAFRSTDIVGRFGGDEFLVMIRGMSNQSLLEDKCRVLQRRLRQVAEEECSIPITCSIGGVVVKDMAADFSGMFKQADAAMYQAKHGGKDRFVLRPYHHLEEESGDGTPVPDTLQLDRSWLDSRIFSAFADTAERHYVCLTNLATGVTRWSPSAVDYFGLPGEYMKDGDQIWAQCIHPDDRSAFLDDIASVVRGEKNHHSMEYRIRNCEGRYIICSCHCVVLKGENGEPDLFAGTLENHGLVDSIDPVTGLYNVYEFQNDLQLLLQEVETDAAVVMVGVSHFRSINQVYGYDFGNQILSAFGARLRELVGSSGAVWRVDGAKFALRVRNTDKDEMADLYRRIQTLAREEVLVNGALFPLELSGGGVLLRHHNTTPSVILSCAAYALESSKRRRDGEFVIFENELGDRTQRTMDLLLALQRDVTMDECSGFSLCYQPLISGVDNSILAVEALTRWNKEPFGSISPGEFIPLLENDRCFFALGMWILRQAMTDGLKLLELQPDLMVNVNVSHAQLDRYAFRDALMDLLHDTGFPAKNLCLELTERCRSIRPDYLAEELRFFRSQGIQIALDDFGTGLASLGLFHTLPMDWLKIDQTFISGIRTSPMDQSIVEAVVHWADHLDLRVCIEGVEDAETQEFLQRYPVAAHQGYHYSFPLPLAELITLLEKGSI